MTCASSIIRHINLVPIGMPFTTRDCLKYGSRGAVDKALARYVDSGIIVRLTSGVFMRMDGKTPLPSPLNLARIKARAFGKALVQHGADLAHEHDFVNSGNKEATFLVNGGNSSFRYGPVRVYLQSSSNKRMQMHDSATGQAVRALWYLGQDGLSIKMVELAIVRANTPDIRRQLVLAKAWMPAWLADYFPTSGYPCPLNAPAQDAYFRDYFDPSPRVEEESRSWGHQFNKFASADLQHFALAGLYSH